MNRLSHPFSLSFSITKYSTILLLAFLSFSVHAEPVELTGHLTQGGVLIGQAPPGSRVVWKGEALPISDEGKFVFGLAKDASQTTVLAVTLPNGEDWETEITPTVREFQVQRIDGLEPAKVTPPPEVMERIVNDAHLARTARQTISEHIGFDVPFIWPVKGRITGVYGAQRILNGEPRAPHWGVDIAAPTGTPVLAPAAGKIALVHKDMYFSGGTLFVDHGHGLMSAFLHLDQIDVVPGQWVDQGEPIATVGSTGRSTGPHLDWRVSWRDVRVDAQLLVQEAE
ncbi:MAG TPA: M23 family metallopeptidase [Wenzhouxiangella sp.]